MSCLMFYGKRIVTIKQEQKITALRKLRWRARTDILFLCNQILNYRHVEAKMHGPIIELLQKFPIPTPAQEIENDKWEENKFVYTPIKRMSDLPGKRRSLILWPRSTLKTTLNVQAHVIQWLLNYPDAAIAVFQSNTEKAEMLVQEIKRHFQFNEKFRELFPEYCPPINKAGDFGKAAQFTVLARKEGRREPSVMALTIEKGTAGVHFDVMKFTDIVEPENVKTDERINSVKKSFYLAEPLLVTPNHWIDVEGTRYHQLDLYGELIDAWLKQKKNNQEPIYKVAISSCWKRKYPAEPFYTPDSLALPFDKGPDGLPISIWPFDVENQPRLSYAALMDLKSRDPYTFSTQYLNSPEGGIGGREIFEGNPQAIKTSNFYTNVRVAYRVMSIDTAETNQEYSNNSAISIGAWGSDGRCYVEDIQFGKWLPNELIHQIIELCQKYKPQTIFIEKTSFVTGLMIGLTAAMQRANLYVPIEQVRRSTKIEKIERIQNSLQPWYRSGQLRFVLKEPNESDNSPTRGGINDHNWEQTIKEFRNFPKGSDDILDSLSDLFTGKEYFGKLTGDHNWLQGNQAEITRRRQEEEQKLRIDALYKHIGIIDNNETPYVPSYNDMTGGL